MPDRLPAANRRGHDALVICEFFARRAARREACWLHTFPFCIVLVKLDLGLRLHSEAGLLKLPILVKPPGCRVAEAKTLADLSQDINRPVSLKEQLVYQSFFLPPTFGVLPPRGRPGNASTP